MSFVHMRIARPVTRLDVSLQMYSEGLGLNRIAEFADHKGFSGVMVGREQLPWHIEFTTCHTHPVKPSPTEDDLLVLYYPDNAEWEEVCARMVSAGFVVVPSFNPYWDANGRTFADPDGYRVVICNKGWVTVEAG